MIFHEKFEIVFSNAQKSLDQRQVQPQDVSQSVLAISNWLKDNIDNNLSVKRLELINHIVLSNFETYFHDCMGMMRIDGFYRGPSNYSAIIVLLMIIANP